MGLWEYSIFSMAVAGGCLGFLVWNLHPAKVFMGDTGSDALYLAVLAATGNPAGCLIYGTAGNWLASESWMYYRHSNSK